MRSEDMLDMVLGKLLNELSVANTKLVEKQLAIEGKDRKIKQLKEELTQYRLEKNESIPEHIKQFYSDEIKSCIEDVVIGG